MEAAFSDYWDGVFIKRFSTTSAYGFWVNFKQCTFIQRFFFCCRKASLKSGVNQFSSLFSVLNNGGSFSGLWKLHIVSARQKKCRQKKNCLEFLKSKEKMVFTSQKIRCPLARIGSFFENCFPPNTNNGFH